MKYRTIGHTDIRVSAVGLGCNNFGMILDQEATRNVVAAALDAGITFFDTADIYGPSEDYLGEALGARRKDAIIATKFGMAGGDLTGGASRAYIVEAAERSLKRLRTDYIDLFYLHMPDPKVPIDETLEALHKLLSAGKIRAIGASNMTAELLDQADRAAQRLHIAGFHVTQEKYNLLEREIEASLIPAVERLQMSLIPYFPLANGMLTGKYQRGAALPADSRLSKVEWGNYLLTDAHFDRIERLTAAASARGLSLIDLAFAWLLSKPFIPSVIAGATSMAQVQANARTAKLDLDSAFLEEIADILA